VSFEGDDKKILAMPMDNGSRS